MYAHERVTQFCYHIENGTLFGHSYSAPILIASATVNACSWNCRTIYFFHTLSYVVFPGKLGRKWTQEFEEHGKYAYLLVGSQTPNCPGLALTAYGQADLPLPPPCIKCSRPIHSYSADLSNAVRKKTFSPSFLHPMIASLRTFRTGTRASQLPQCRRL